MVMLRVVKSRLVESTFNEQVGNVQHNLGELTIIVRLVAVHVSLLQNTFGLKVQ